MKKLVFPLIFITLGLMLAFSATPTHAGIASTPLNLGSCGFILFGNWDTNSNTCTLSGGSGYSSTFLLTVALQIPSGTTLTVDSGNSLDAFWGIVNNGTINNYGVTSNTGVTGLTLEGLSLYNSGVLNNYGDIYLQVLTLGTCVQSNANCYPTLENDAGGVVNNEGSIISVYCTFEGENCSSAGQVTNEAGGDFTNSGTITLTQPTGVCAASPNGGDCFSNSGDFRTIISSGSCTSIPLSQSWNNSNNTCTIGSGTTYTISAGSSILVPPGITLAVDGTIANNGEIDNDGVIFVSGAISPFGTVTNSDGSTVTFVLSSSLCTGTLDGSWSSNTCTIGSGQTSIFDSAYILQINSGLTLVNQGTLAITLNLYSGGSFTNTGTFTSQNFMNNYGTITNSGSFDNTASAEIQDVGPISNSGTFTNEGSISLTCIDSPEGSGCGTLLNTGTFENSGTVSGYSDSITEACVATFSGNQPPAGAIRNIPCAPTITSPSGTVSIALGTTVSGTENLASNGGNPLTIYVSNGCFLCNDLLAYTTTSSSGAWSVFVPLSPGTDSLYAVAYTCSGGVNQGCYASEYGSLGSNSITVTVDNSLDQTTCQSVIGGSWSSASNTCTSGGQFTFLSGDSLTIGSSATLVNQASGKLTNDGTLSIQGTLTNQGTFANPAAGTVTDSGTITNTGTITNSGSFTVNLDMGTCQSYPLNGVWTYVALFSTCSIPSGTSDTILAGMVVNVPNGDVIYNSGAISNLGTISLSVAAFYDNACEGALSGNAVTGSGTIQYAPCSPTITSSGGVYLTGSLTVSGTSDIASNGGNQMTIALYADGSEIGSGTTTGATGAWTITGTPAPGVLTLYAIATSSENIASPPSSSLTVTYQLLDQASCQSPIGGTWASSTCFFGGTFLLPETGALVIPSGTTFTISGSGELTNNGAITNMGTVTNDGTLTNAYVLVSNEPAGGSLLDAGTITNSGTLTNAAQLTVESGGIFTNYAQFSDDSYHFGGIDGGGQLVVNSGGTFTNSLEATMTGQQSSSVGNSGAFTNEGSVINQDFSNFGNSATLLNSGTMSMEGTIFDANSGTLTNAPGGSISVFSTPSGGELPEVEVYGGVFNNYGNFNLTYVGELYIYPGASFTNGVGATMTDQFGTTVAGTLTNYGSISNTINPALASSGPSQFGGSARVYGTFANYGSFANTNVNSTLTVESGGIYDNYGLTANFGATSNVGTFDEYCGSTFTGNAVSGTSPVTITAVACPPAITSPGTVETTTGSATPTISGTAAASVTVNLYLVSSGTLQPLGTTTSTSGGAWSVTTSPLSSGTYTLIATASSSAGASGLSNHATLDIATSQATTTSLSCGSPVTTGTTANCTATVSGASPSGKVSFTSLPISSALGLPPSCTLSPVTAGTSSCAVTLTPASGSQASYTMTASYGGDANNAVSSGITALVVEQPNTTAQGSSSTTISNGGASSDQTSMTGAAVTISGSSAPAGTSVTITTEDLSSPSSDVGVSNLLGTQYYDVSVMGITDGTAQVCITSNTPTLTMEYWAGSSWVEASSITTTGDTTCGAIPVSALTGTNVIIGDPVPASLSVSPTSAEPGTMVSLSGSGYDASLSYSACLSSSSTTQSCVSGSSNPVGLLVGGSLPLTASIQLPDPLSAGSYFVIVFPNIGGGPIASYAPFTVISSPTISTSLSASSMTIGGSATDTATFSGGTDPTGTMTFNAYQGSSCDILVFSSSVSVSGDGMYASDVFTPSVPGAYYFDAVYSGDANNNAYSTPCSTSSEVLTVNQASPTLTTSLSSGSIFLSQSATDTATIAGLVDPTGAGTISITVYSAISSGACVDPEGTSTFVVSSSSVTSYPSSSFTPTAPGTYYWEAVFTGDANNQGSTTQCGVSGEVLGVSMGSPALTTSLSSPSIFMGSSVSDTAVITGGINPTGTISFTAFTNLSCAGPFTFSTVTLSPSVTSYTSGLFTPSATGTYYFVAYYSGDANNNAYATPCETGGEVLAVSLGSPTMTTLLSSPSIVVGSSVTDTATISGLENPTGTGIITFDAYQGSSCDGSVFQTSVTISSDGSYASPAFTPNGLPSGPGTYYWAAHYSGDANNSPYNTPCDGEVLAVSAASPSVTTSLSSSSVTLGGSVTDTATIAGLVDPTGAGTISITVYSAISGGACVGPEGTSVSVVSSSSGTTFTSAPFYAYAPGAYYFDAYFTGDIDNSAFTTPCGPGAEVLAVNQASSSVTTQVINDATSSPPSGSEVSGASFHDTAAVTGISGFTPTGDVTYQLFGDGTCAGTPSATTTVALSGVAAPPSSSTGPTGAGSYSFSATYSGDSNYYPSFSTCEAFAVNKASPTLTTLLSNSGTITVGSSATDASTLSGAFSPNGSVTFVAYSDPACTLSVFTSTQGLAGSSATSGSFTPANAGTYYWKASYPGDSNNNGATSSCEPLTVAVTSPTVATSLSPTTINAGQSVYDSGKLTGATTTASGTVTYEYFSGASCSGSPTVVGSPVTVTNAVALNSASHAFGAGSYGWEAVYSGDSNNNGATSPCESLSVQKAPSSSSVSCTPNPVTIGSSTTCTAKVTGDSPGGSVAFTTSSSTGTFSPPSGQCTLSGGACSVSYSDTTARALTITTSYGGDSNNLVSSASTSLTEGYKNCQTQVHNGGGQNLAGANLEYCNLAGYRMGGDNLRGANLQYTDLQNTNLQGTDLRNANLASSNAPGATFQGSNLASATLTNVNAAGANFQGANLATANLQGATLTGDNLQGANLADANLSGDAASGANFQGDNLAGANLSNGDFDHGEFQGANLAYSNMSYGNFSYANFAGANAQGANTTGANFTGAVDPPSDRHR